MRISRLAQDIKGFQIISNSNGQIIGRVEDLLVDMNTLQVAAIVTFTGNLLDSNIKAIPRKDIELWGEDVILTTGVEVIFEQNKLDDSGNWASVLNNIKGKDVLNTKGERIAVLNDVVIDSEGQIVGYDLSKVFIEGPVEKSKRIHRRTTHTMGADALIIDTENLYKWEMTTE